MFGAIVHAVFIVGQFEETWVNTFGAHGFELWSKYFGLRFICQTTV